MMMPNGIASHFASSAAFNAIFTGYGSASVPVKQYPAEQDNQESQSTGYHIL